MIDKLFQLFKCDGDGKAPTKDMPKPTTTSTPNIHAGLKIDSIHPVQQPDVDQNKHSDIKQDQHMVETPDLPTPAKQPNTGISPRT